MLIVIIHRTQETQPESQENWIAPGLDINRCGHSPQGSGALQISMNLVIVTKVIWQPIIKHLFFFLLLCIVKLNI
jgi:hypothetical protein